MHWLHRYNRLLAAATLLLITAGGLVTSTGSGLAVPDWPNTYGYFMLPSRYPGWWAAFCTSMGTA